MSTIDYDPLDEEEAFTDTSLNAGFTEVEDGINALGMDAVKRYSLRGEHQPSLTPAVEHPTITWTKELTGDVAPDPAGSTWDGNENSDPADYGFQQTDTTNVAVRGPEGELSLDLNLTLGMGGEHRIGALLVLANVRIGMMYQLYQYTTHNNLVVLTIQVKDSTGWHDVPRTRRSLSQPGRNELEFTPIADDPSSPTYANTWAAFRFVNQVDFDIPLRTLIGAADVPDGDGVIATILGVRVVIKGVMASTAAPSDINYDWTEKLNAADGTAYYTTGQANLSIIPFHALAVMN